MTRPIGLSRKAHAAFQGERWNAFINLISTADPDDLTPIQRVAFLGWWYSSEVLNGGHDQYFGNNDQLDHGEVIEALKSLGANFQMDVLKSAVAFYSKAQIAMPQEYDEYVLWDESYGYTARMQAFDEEFYQCRPEIESELLERYLDANESEFIHWTE